MMEEVIFSPAVDNRHFAGHGAFLNVDDLAFDAVMSGNFRGVSPEGPSCRTT